MCIRTDESEITKREIALLKIWVSLMAKGFPAKFFLINRKERRISRLDLDYEARIKILKNIREVTNWELKEAISFLKGKPIALSPRVAKKLDKILSDFGISVKEGRKVLKFYSVKGRIWKSPYPLGP